VGCPSVVGGGARARGRRRCGVGRVASALRRRRGQQDKTAGSGYGGRRSGGGDGGKGRIPAAAAGPPGAASAARADRRGVGRRARLGALAAAVGRRLISAAAARRRGAQRAGSYRLDAPRRVHRVEPRGQPQVEAPQLCNSGVKNDGSPVMPRSIRDSSNEHVTGTRHEPKARKYELTKIRKDCNWDVFRFGK